MPGGPSSRASPKFFSARSGRVDAAGEFNHIIVATVAGTPIRISDIGYAEDTTERPRQAVWLGGSPAVMLDVRRATGENRSPSWRASRRGSTRSAGRCRGKSR